MAEREHVDQAQPYGLRTMPLLTETSALMKTIDPDELLLAYRLGVFPMAETREAQNILWIRPNTRCVLPLNSFHVPKRLARTVRSDRFSVRCDSDFGMVIRKCAAAGPQRDESWINLEIIDVFEELHRRGHAHSVEAWEGEDLVGGLYGLSIGGAFFGESMFSLQTDASKVALVHLVARLKQGGYRLLDAQFPNPHLEQFGAWEISEEEFGRLLEQATQCSADFYSMGTSGGSSGDGSASVSESSASWASGSSSARKSSGSGGGASVLQLITHTS
jgi:leucyl/phenylalanyl-tRNA--protein transferase